MKGLHPNSEPTFLEKVGLKIVKSSSHLPQHYAFILDGNRRYAKNVGQSPSDGHIKGFENMEKVSFILRPDNHHFKPIHACMYVSPLKIIDWVLHLGGKEVTVYAFSIENFKRSEAEVMRLMDIFRGLAKSWLNEKFAIFERKRIRFQLWGDASLLPSDLQELFANLTLATKSFDGYASSLILFFSLNIIIIILMHLACNSELSLDLG